MLWSVMHIAESNSPAADAERELASVRQLAKERASLDVRDVVLTMEERDVTRVMEDVLSRAGLPRGLMTSASPGGEDWGSGEVVRVSGSVVLEGATLADLGQVFSVMRVHHPAWRVQSIQIVPLEPVGAPRGLRTQMTLDAVGTKGGAS